MEEEIEDKNEDENENETAQEKEERILHNKINAYILENIRENIESLLSPEAILGFYNYYKTKPRFTSSYKENESGNPHIANMINQIIEKMLIVNPLQRPSVHRLKSQFNKIILSLLSQNYFKSISLPRKFVSQGDLFEQDMSHE